MGTLSYHAFTQPRQFVGHTAWSCTCFMDKILKICTQIFSWFWGCQPAQSKDDPFALIFAAVCTFTRDITSSAILLTNSAILQSWEKKSWLLVQIQMFGHFQMWILSLWLWLGASPLLRSIERYFWAIKALKWDKTTQILGKLVHHTNTLHLALRAKSFEVML